MFEHNASFFVYIERLQLYPLSQSIKRINKNWNTCRKFSSCCNTEEYRVFKAP